MKRITLFLFAITLPLSPLGKLSAREPWVTLTGLTEDQANSRVGTFSNSQTGVVPQQICGYVENNAPRFSMLWAPRGDGDNDSRRVIFSQTSAQLISTNNQLQPLGWRMRWINGYEFDDTPYFNAIWVKTDGIPQLLRIGDSQADFQAAKSQMAGTHYLENLCVYRDGTAVRYASIWNQSNFALSSQISYGLTGEELNDDVQAKKASWHIHNLCGYTLPFVLNGQSPIRYTVIWRSGAAGQFGVIPNMTKENFFATDSNQTGVGWRTSFLQMWNQGDEVLANAMWLPDGGLKQAYINQLDAVVRDAMEANEIPSVSLAISRRGKIVFKRAYGFADEAGNEWAGTDHRYRIASVSKAITGVAVVHALASQSTWNLNSKVFGSGALFGTDYGSAPYSTYEQDISVRNLLTHTAGWLDDGNLWYDDEPSYGSQHKPFIDYQLQNRSVTYDPGTIGRYSNLGFTIAARVVEKISGDSYETYARNELFAPCGISPLLGPLVGERTRAQKKFMEVSYYTTSANTGSPETVDPRRMDGSTAWIARPADLLLLARRVDGDTRYDDILAPDRITALHTRATPDSSSGYPWQRYGLGWYCDDYSNPTRWGHNGSMNGTRAELVVGVGANENAYSWVANAQGDVPNDSIDSILDDITANNDWPDIDLSGTWHPAYNAWLAEHFTGVERTTGMEAILLAPEADPDGDHLPNAAEYYLGTDPRAVNDSPFSLAKSGNNLRIRWQRKTGIEGATITHQGSSNMSSWTSFLQPEIIDRPDLISQVGYSYQEVLIPISGTRRFARFDFQIH
ncbi:serine hydrolase [Haloferula sp. BvORR071]|uniref:serine hydrolase n=1 Tax=Haloferula sp. BvORR071 TaxID=1396141 RepID=UPI00054E11A5|nr:serine hydrolase [Haloferula sp. BvORR071]